MAKNGLKISFFYSKWTKLTLKLVKPFMLTIFQSLQFNFELDFCLFKQILVPFIFQFIQFAEVDYVCVCVCTAMI